MDISLPEIDDKDVTDKELADCFIRLALQAVNCQPDERDELYQAMQSIQDELAVRDHLRPDAEEA